MTIKDCFKCDIAYRRKNIVNGQGNIHGDILIVGEAPGYHEDKNGVPFVGESGILLRNTLSTVGFTFANSYITNVIKCRPPSNRDPSYVEINNCKEYFNKELDIMKPRLIILLGRIANETFFGNHNMLLKELITKVHITKNGTYIATNYHPAFIIRKKGDDRKYYEAIFIETFEKIYKVYVTKINKNYEQYKNQIKNG